ncbi:MAG: MBL fold metallo-hydrolase [Pseudomonadota bacterium]
MRNFASGRKCSFTNQVVIVLLGLLIAGCSSSTSEEQWAEGKPGHHTQNGFRNYPDDPEFGPVNSGFYFRRVMDSFFLPDVPGDHYLPEKDAIERYQQLAGHNTITWLGHATFLIRMNGLTILTDPFLTEYSGPFWIIGARRFVQPGISLDNLPPIDIVVATHNHPDHLDAETIESLPVKDNIRVFAPLGLTPFFKDKGYTHVEELDWEESHTFGGIEFTALPTIHYSGRGMNDKNKTLWCAWSIKSPSTKVFFSGDTAYSPTIFKNIGEERGPYDAALVTIGAYKTRQYGPASHLTPEEAIKVVMETHSDIAVAMHWGTIELSDEPPLEPPERFKKAALQNDLPADNVWVMKIGETRLLVDEMQKRQRE